MLKTPFYISIYSSITLKKKKIWGGGNDKMVQYKNLNSKRHNENRQEPPDAKTCSNFLIVLIMNNCRFNEGESCVRGPGCVCLFLEETPTHPPPYTPCSFLTWTVSASFLPACLQVILQRAVAGLM